MFYFAGFVLDPDRAELHGPEGSAIRLRPKAFELLKFLVANNRRVVGKQELMETVWPGIHVGEDSLFQCIREIRTALGDADRHMIKLVSGRGYLFNTDVSTAPERADFQTNPRNASVSKTIAGHHGPERRFGSRKAFALGIFAVLCLMLAVFALGIFSPGASDIFESRQPVIEVLPIVDSDTDPQSIDLAQAVAAEMINGLAKIDGIRLIAPREQGPVTTAEAISGRSHAAGLLLQGELQKGPQSWIFRTRLINVSSSEIESVSEITLDASDPDRQRLASRLAGGAGYQLAIRLNRFRQTDDEPQDRSASVAIQQATASINQTTKERFATAGTILEKYLRDQPDNADLQIALAELHLRGIQLAWYGPAESKAAEDETRSLLERALRTRPASIQVLGVYCRFLTVTNQFSESLVACARALNLNPWDGTALFHLGLTQLQLGRFEDALATFEQADRFDTPDVSRWTWLLGAGWAELLLNHNEDAIRWLRRSIAITPGTGRGHMLLATAYQRLGQPGEARQALATALQLRPGSTAANISLPSRNASPIFLDARQKVNQTLLEVGLPPGDAEQKSAE